MSGKKATAPCGHEGEHVIGTYVQCKKCDKQAIPKHVDPEITEPMFRLRGCPKCGSIEIEQFDDDLDAAIWNAQNTHPSGPTQPAQAKEWHCWACGKVFTKPVWV